MVNVELAPVVPGVTVGGAKLAVAPGGNPLAASVTTLSYAPLTGFTLIVYVATPPG